MARSLLKTIVRDSAGNSIQSARVYVYESGTTTPVADLYPSAVGGVPQVSLLSNAQGEITGWLDTPRNVALKTTDNNGQAVYPTVNPDAPVNDALASHIANPEGAHAASAISLVDDRGVTNVQTALERMRRPLIDVTDFGATGLGFPNDDRDAIYDATIYAAANGGSVFFPPTPPAGGNPNGGNYYMATPIDLCDPALVGVPIHLLGAADPQSATSFGRPPRTSIFVANDQHMFTTSDATRAASVTFENLALVGGSGTSRCVYANANFLITLRNSSVYGRSTTTSPFYGVNTFWVWFDFCELAVSSDLVWPVEFESTQTGNGSAYLTRFTDVIFVNNGVRLNQTGNAAGTLPSDFIFDFCSTEDFTDKAMLQIDSQVASPPSVDRISMNHPGNFDQSGVCPYVQINDNMVVGAIHIINPLPNSHAIETNDTAQLWESFISGVGTGVTTKNGAVNAAGVPTGGQTVSRINGFDLIAFFALNGVDDTDLTARGGGIIRGARSGDSYARYMVDRDGGVSLGPGGVVAAHDVFYGARAAAGVMTAPGMELTEMSDPAAPAANRVRFYTRDNGAGKTQVVARFPTGAVQVIATEP